MRAHLPQPEPTANVINFAERVGERIALRLPVLQASGVMLDPAPSDDLPRLLHSTRQTLEMVIDHLTGKRTDNYATSPAIFLARRAGVLYRCVGQLKAAEKLTAKLDRKLAKAKRKLKRRA